MATPKSGATAPIKLDEHQLETLAGIGCTLAEMASVMKCSVDTIGRNFAEVVARGREQGKASVRRMMWEQGKRGNSVALKYLVHNVLHERIEEAPQMTDAQIQAAALMEKLNAISSDTILRLIKSPPKVG